MMKFDGDVFEIDIIINNNNIIVEQVLSSLSCTRIGNLRVTL